jgi:hypothetical protein
MDKKTTFTILGFLLFVFGFISLVLLLVGLQLSFLAFIDAGSRLTGFIIRLLMVFGGLVMVYLARTDWDGSDQ